MADMNLTSDNFEEEIAKGVVLVDFWAPWCGPCRMLGPVLEEIGKEMEGKVRVLKVNVDEQEALAQKFSIMSIPAVYVFKDGEVVENMIGLQPKEAFVEVLNKHLA